MPKLKKSNSTLLGDLRSKSVTRSHFNWTKFFKNAKIEKWGIFGWFSNIVFCFSCKALVSLPNKNMVHILQNIQILEYTLCTTVFHLRCEVLFSIKRPFFAAIFLWKCNSFANKNLLICFALEQLVQLWKKKKLFPSYFFQKTISF